MNRLKAYICIPKILMTSFTLICVRYFTINIFAFVHFTYFSL
jgi:hypothetical protein